jgi:uncharacterized protein with HEPN domain
MRDLTDYLDDIKTAIADIEDFTKGLTFKSFSKDKKTVNAVIRSLEVLGEASKHIPKSFRQKYPDIPWSKMTGMRDVLIHDYMGVDLKTVWKVIKERLPEMKPFINALSTKKRVD